MQRTEYDVHPAASIFPMMTEAEFVTFKEDISRHGCTEPIVLLDGKLIDGRNRLKACNELGIEPMESELTDDVDPIQYVLSANLHRRHLTESQRALCAGKVATLKNGGDRRSEEFTSQNCELNRDEAAKMFSVSARSVDAAKEVIEHGTNELVEAVSQGAVKVSSAEKLVRKVTDKREQRRLVKEGAIAIRDAVRKPPKARRTTQKQTSITSVVALPSEPNSDDIAEVSAWIARHDKRPAVQRFMSLWNECNDVQKAAIRATVLDETTT